MDKEKLIELTGNDFFTSFKQYSKLKIPTTLKKLLTLCSHDRIVSLSEFDEKSVSEIEDFARNIFHKHMIRKGESVKDYLGVFSNAQAKYVIMSGEKKILEKVSEICTALYREENVIKSATNGNVDLDTDSPKGSSLLTNTNLIGSTVNRYTDSTLFNLIASQIIVVYNDAKRTSLSAFSWPSRQVASQMAHNYKSTGRTNVDNIDLLYLSPTHHEELLDCVVSSDIENFRSILRNALAVSLRVDGSTDKTQQHNIYVMVHVITDSADMKTFFLGFGTPASGNAGDYFETTKSIVGNIVPWDELFPLITSLVTDGESLNSGRIQGLWQKMKDERLQSDFADVPLIIVWCAAHRINLAWKSTANNELVKNAILDGRRISKHFHRSGNRTQALKSTASVNTFSEPLRYPKYFEIRWSEFTFSLFYVILRNWRASIAYFREKNLTSMLDCWLLYDRIHLFSFLTDLLTILKSFQKACESDCISILEISQKLTKAIERLTALQNTPLEHGWEQLFLDKVETHEDDTAVFCNEELLRPVGEDSCIFAANDRIHIIQSLITFLTERMDDDTVLRDELKPLLHIKATTTLESLRLCHSSIIPESDINLFVSEYYQVADLLKDVEFKSVYSNLQQLKAITSRQFVLLPRALARAASIKPHSADVERLINIYNKFKDDDRSSMSPTTLFNYLYIKTNMPSLEEFDPTVATRHWLARKQRKPRVGSKAKGQEWFNGVFKECTNRNRTPKIIEF